MSLKIITVQIAWSAKGCKMGAYGEARECPRCGETKNAFCLPHGRRYRVSCDCGWYGPSDKTGKIAIDLWNTRPVAE